jgi:nitrite reductase/ring-hydroxylating ferredoxin subunit
MSDKKYDWHLIAEHGAELDWNSNSIAVVEVKGKKICVAKAEEQWFAFAHKCPHAGAVLSYGHIDAACNIVCPVHRYKFNLRNGYNSSGEGYYLKTYPIKQSEEGLFIGIPEGGLFSWL